MLNVNFHLLASIFETMDFFWWGWVGGGGGGDVLCFVTVCINIFDD